MYLLFSEQD